MSGKMAANTTRLPNNLWLISNSFQQPAARTALASSNKMMLNWQIAFSSTKQLR